MDKEYRFHKGARTALKIVGVLCILLVVAAPLGLWILWRVSKAKLRITSTGVHASSITTVSFQLVDVARLGICRIPILARGIGGALARYKVGGDHGINLCVVLRNGKKLMITVSMYEDYEAALDAISAAVGKPYEPLEMGAFGVRWPEAKAT